MPDLKLNSIYDIDLTQLKTRGIRGFIFDIDNTLASYDDAVADEKLTAWFRELTDQGFSAVLVSNNNRKRVQLFAESVGLRYCSRAFKPAKGGLKAACKMMNISPQNTALVGDQVFTDIIGGNRMKMLTILVPPISDKDTRFVRFKRKLEKRLMKS